MELGKQLAKSIHGELTGQLGAAEHDSSTSRLIALYQKVNGVADAPRPAKPAVRTSRQPA
ncbi:hypothetical protein AVW16_13750 [Crenobacter luteus]|uniref:Uncharacterized protein n=1 Tax=Crenobacter luteus TaxID=1452487 RepID=A0A165EX81_9NEIS|nr:hypothetical protein AVW16_13750 [Crenobacter luteus]